jgi:hypothetical protein
VIRENFTLFLATLCKSVIYSISIRTLLITYLGGRVIVGCVNGWETATMKLLRSVTYLALCDVMLALWNSIYYF